MIRKKGNISGTKEWAATNENIQTGCEHDCKYCYAKCMALRFARATVESWAEPVPLKNREHKRFKKRAGRIMFPTTHDITPNNVQSCMAMLERMLSAGNDVLIVSKPHLACIQALCNALGDYRQQILFRFTIGSANNDVLGFWEPGAPRFEERLDSLVLAHENGFQTSVSCEPMLDVNIDAVVHAVDPYVSNATWLGKANRMRQITALTCPGNQEVRRKVDELIAIQNDQAIKALYQRHKDNPKIKWKDSIKKVIGLEAPPEAGMDI